VSVARPLSVSGLTEIAKRLDQPTIRHLPQLWSSTRDRSPLAQIRARVDYVNGLQENLKGQEAASEEVRAEFKALVEQCRTALRNRADEND
jgi:hypothetical protein